MIEKEYYSKKLSALRLKRCYEIASPRIKQYLEAEIQYVLGQIIPSDTVLELGCGYGRVLGRLSKKAQTVYGIDISEASIILAQEFLTDLSNVKLQIMNVQSLAFADQVFDMVIAIQNGLSAFKGDPNETIKESIRVTKPGGKVLFSSYSEKIWEERLNWFIQQSKNGLLGEIDLEKSKKGEIIGKDGFKATTYTPEYFSLLSMKLGLKTEIKEIDQSSIFWIIHVNH